MSPTKIVEILSNIIKNEYNKAIVVIPSPITRLLITTHNKITPKVCYVFKTHTPDIFVIQNHVFTNVNAIMKVYHLDHDQNKTMGNLGTFTENVHMKEQYKLIEHKERIETHWPTPTRNRKKEP